MDGFNEKSLVLRESKCFTDIKSRYPLRNTPARSESNRVSCFVQRANRGSPIPSNLLSSLVAKSPEPPCPLRNRILAIQNSEEKEELLESGNKDEVGAKEDVQDLECRKIVSETLLEFRRILDKLKKSRNGSESIHYRPNLLAYSIFKRNKKDLNFFNKRIGNMPGVEIGDEFEYKVELVLTGLHPCRAGTVGHITKGEKFIAISILYNVSCELNKIVGMYNDVLVCSSCENKSNNIKLERANLALKNSADEKNPIRVVLSFGNVIKRYIYAGLYFVQKSWRKRGNVYYFELKRLENQAELDIKSLVKPVSSNVGSEKINEDEHVRHENGRVNCLGKRKREEKEEGDEFYIKGDEHAENRKRIKQLMYDFLSTYEKMLEDKRARKKKMDRAGRYDLGTYNIMKSKHRYLRNVDKHFGCISGVEVGDIFHFRVQLLMLGLHCSTGLDIDYLIKDDKLLATSIASIHFEEFDKNAFRTDTLLFCGYGPKDADQKLEVGNLALKNNIDAKIPIRIFRGLRKTKEATIYVYCGLYMVEKYWKKKNNNGYDVFVFRLNRLPGQTKVNFEGAKEFLSLLARSRAGYSNDISRGKEKIPIRVVNTVDNENLPPFKYTTSVVHSSNFYPIPEEGCDCVGGCTDSDKCACAVRNGGELPFNSEGLIVKAKPLIYECGPSCKCPPSCSNKVSQNGIKFPFEVFKTEKMGWGVRSRAFIPMGSFICEFVGELLNDEEAQKRTNDDYMFAIGNNYYDKLLWEGLSSVPCLQKRAPTDDSEYDGGFSIDASIYGNFGRLINHNCTPNVYAQNVLYDHDDIRMPHIMFFACEDIPPNQELCYHYNYTIDGVHDSNGNIRKKNCYCGSIECTGRLY